MQDDKFKDIFNNFEPELSSDMSFMNKLQRNLDSVEIIKQHNAEVKAANRKAVVIAAFVGFVIGFLLSRALPYVDNFMVNIQANLATSPFIRTLADNYLIAAWFVIACSSLLITLNTYEAAIHLLKPKHQNAL